MFKVNNKDFEPISYLVLVFLLLVLSRKMPAGLRLNYYFWKFEICNFWKGAIFNECSKNSFHLLVTPEYQKLTFRFIEAC